MKDVLTDKKNRKVDNLNLLSKVRYIYSKRERLLDPESHKKRLDINRYKLFAIEGRANRSRFKIGHKKVYNRAKGGGDFSGDKRNI